MEPPTAYLDTCILSGLAKEDLAAAETAALLRILQARKRGEITIVTSEVARDEIAQVPEAHRSRHEMIYNLLNDVPLCATHRTDSGLLMMGVGGGWCEDSLFATLKTVLPDAADAEHVFQAAKNNVRLFITTDRRTMVRHAAAVEEVCGVKILTPTEFERAILSSGADGGDV
jgi:hypothetical protein